METLSEMLGFKEVKEMEIKKEFSCVEWVATVEEIVDGYFDDGTYTPHYGLINAMRVFYNRCIINGKWKAPHDASSVEDMEEFINDPEFLNAFNDSLYVNSDIEYHLDFGNAYATALEVVNQRTNSWGELTNMISSLINAIIEEFKSLVTEDNINLLRELGKKIEDGGITADAIVEAYGNSDMMKSIPFRNKE